MQGTTEFHWPQCGHWGRLLAAIGRVAALRPGGLRGLRTQEVWPPPPHLDEPAPRKAREHAPCSSRPHLRQGRLGLWEP